MMLSTCNICTYIVALPGVTRLASIFGSGERATVHFCPSKVIDEYRNVPWLLSKALSEIGPLMAPDKLLFAFFRGFIRDVRVR